MPRVAIIDYGVGNLRSVEKAFAAMGCAAVVSGDGRVLRAAERLVLPGVGAFRACVGGLRARGFDELVRERTRAGVPLLGVCVGMQMLFEASEEFGETEGLRLLGGRVRRFAAGLHVPQVGWNNVRQLQPEHPLFASIADGAFFYFVHSYYAAPKDADVVVATTDYGVDFASVLWRDNLYATQFHPEKSQHWGLRILQNFFALSQGKRPR